MDPNYHENEKDARRALAAAFRWAARLDFHESIANHFSFAIDPDGDKFLINPRGDHFSRVRGSELVLARAGQPDRERIDLTAWALHAQIHQRVARARCIMHTHMPYTTALSCLKDFEFLMLDQNACRFYERISYDRNYAGMAIDEAEGARVAALFDEGRDILILGNHGVMVIADSIASAFDELYHLERAAQVQVLALSTGRELSIIPNEMARLACEQWREYPRFSELHFSALMEILDIEEPDYRE
jgi:ribulose-5-phosphate 4-epimerase/fuculose-1-phosphate aldolase